MSKRFLWTLQKRKNGNLKNKQNDILYHVNYFLFNRSCSMQITLIKIHHVVQSSVRSCLPSFDQLLLELNFVFYGILGCPAPCWWQKLCLPCETGLRLVPHSLCFTSLRIQNFNPLISSALVFSDRVYQLLLKIHSLIFWVVPACTNYNLANCFVFSEVTEQDLC